MITITSAMTSHLASGNPIVAYCLKITLASGSVKGATSYDREITYDGTTYESVPGVNLGGMSSSAEMNVDSSDAASDYNSNLFTKINLIDNTLRGATYELFFVNPNDTTMGRGLVSKGTIGKVSIKDYDFDFELRSLSQRLQQKVGDSYSPYCRATLGDSKCSVDVAGSYTQTGSVKAVTSNKIFTSDDITGSIDEDDYFNYGLLTWTSGNNNGKEMQVRDSEWDDIDTYTIELDHPMIVDIEVGDAFSITAGCDHSLDGDCVNKFNNEANCRCEPDVPGNEMDSPLVWKF